MKWYVMDVPNAMATKGQLKEFLKAAGWACTVESIIFDAKARCYKAAVMSAAEPLTMSYPCEQGVMVVEKRQNGPAKSAAAPEPKVQICAGLSAAEAPAAAPRPSGARAAQRAMPPRRSPAQEAGEHALRHSSSAPPPARR